MSGEIRVCSCYDGSLLASSGQPTGRRRQPNQAETDQLPRVRRGVRGFGGGYTSKVT